ncbi:aminodeoxychorismate synthase component I [Thalassotalea sp. LPB0316]|nr:aminodeoxychorismate synthase component I [Thalassotalea sp. LPB0316]
MWLDSCDSQHVDNQYDIFVWQPLVKITTDNDTTQIADQQGVLSKHQVDPLSIVEQQLSKLLPKEDIAPSTLPFSGGAVGYFSYDLGRAFEHLPTIAEKDLPVPDMAVGVYDQALIIDKFNKQTYLFCCDSKRQRLVEQLTQLAKSSEDADCFLLTTPWQSNMSQAQYRDKFDSIQQYLRSGDCYQINLTQRFSAQYQGDEFSAYLKLRAQNNAPFSAYLNLDEIKVLSISPERFIKVDNRQVQTKPIKGTRPRGNTTKQDQANKQALINATKDKAENLMIVDLLRNDLSRACRPGSVKVPKLFDIESFPAVHHLVSTIEGELADNMSAIDLLRGAFPGGSITGAPKIRAMEIIEELEPHRRNIYCGSIGYLSACGNMDTSITIRTLTCVNNQIVCSAGGGIVADSICDEEYQETFDKVNKILPILGEIEQ